MPDLQLDQLKDGLSSVLFEELGELIEGADEDLQFLVDTLANDVLEAVSTNQLHLLDDLADQAVLLAEQRRITIVNQGEATFKKVIRVASRYAMKLIPLLLV